MSRAELLALAERVEGLTAQNRSIDHLAAQELGLVARIEGRSYVPHLTCSEIVRQRTAAALRARAEGGE